MMAGQWGKRLMESPKTGQFNAARRRENLYYEPIITSGGGVSTRLEKNSPRAPGVSRVDLSLIQASEPFRPYVFCLPASWRPSFLAAVSFVPGIFPCIVPDG
jgi:hypothetical protein